MEFQIGMRVRIKGDAEDYTDHLDGMIGVITAVDDEDCSVKVDGRDGIWYIWNKNMTVVSE